MNKKTIAPMTVLALVLLLLGGCMRPSADLACSPFARESIEWQDLWIENAAAKPGKLPRVLMIGDSISRQYRACVTQFLAVKGNPRDRAHRLD